MLIPKDIQLIKVQFVLDFRALSLNWPQSWKNVRGEAPHGFEKGDNSQPEALFILLKVNGSSLMFHLDLPSLLQTIMQIAP